MFTPYRKREVKEEEETQNPILRSARVGGGERVGCPWRDQRDVVQEGRGRLGGRFHPLITARAVSVDDISRLDSNNNTTLSYQDLGKI